MLKLLIYTTVFLIIAAAVYNGWLYLFPPSGHGSYGSSAPDAIRYVALGDSFTVGDGLPSREAWPAQLVTAVDTHGIKLKLVATIARSGWTTTDLIENSRDKIAPLAPRFVTLQIGANDVIQGNSPQRFRDNLHILFDQILGAVPAEQVLVLTIPDFLVTPGGTSFDRNGATASVLREFNSIIQDVAAERRVTVVDVYEVSKEMGQNSVLVGRDGLHPSAAGYLRWVETMLPTVTTMLPKQES